MMNVPIHMFGNHEHALIILNTCVFQRPLFCRSHCVCLPPFRGSRCDIIDQSKADEAKLGDCMASPKTSRDGSFGIRVLNDTQFLDKSGKKVSSWHHFCVMHSEIFMHQI